MASTKLKIRPDKKGRDNELALYVQVCLNSKVKLFPTGQKCHPSYWDEKNQKVKKITGSNEHVKLNMILDKKHQEIKEAILNLTLKNTILTFDAIKDEIEPKELKDDSFDYWFQTFYNSQQLVVKPPTLRHYVVVRNQTVEFNKGKKLKLSNIDFHYYNNFKNWLIQEKKQQNSTVNKRLKILKGFLRFCSNHNVYDDGNLGKFKMLEEKTTTKIALTQVELDTLYNWNFKEYPSYEKVRDLFALACFTGLRESDIQNIKPSNIKENFIYLNIIKTSSNEGIPLNNYAKEILKKYNFQLPHSSQKNTNELLKKIGKIVGISNNEIVVKFQGGKRIEKSIPRYELLSSHVGRRTFITLSIMKGIPIPLIQSITGHKDLKSFQKYIKMNDQAKLDAMKLW